MKVNGLVIFLLLVSVSGFTQLPQFKAIVYDSGSASGYYFLSTRQKGVGRLILDKYGDIVYYKNTHQGLNFFMAPGGKMVSTSLSEAYIYDSTFQFIDSIGCVNYQSDMHELELLPNGHTLLFGLELVAMDLSNFYHDTANGEHSKMAVRSGVLQELDAHKNVVFEWHAKDHLDFYEVDTFFMKSIMGALDWTHFNSATIDTDGNIILSIRNFNEVVKINRKDGSIVWRLGGKHNQFRFLNSPVPFYGQHDVRKISNGHFTLFDGGFHTVCHGARAMEFELDEKNKTARLVWSYTYDSSLYSGGGGGNVQRLDNSNTLVSFGAVNDTANKIGFVVVDSLGRKLFAFKFMEGSVSYTVHNYPVIPNLHRPEFTVKKSPAGLSLVPIGKSSQQLWKMGDTCVSVTEPGKYSIFVPYGDGGFVGSASFIIEKPGPLQNFPKKAKLERTGKYW